MNEIKVEQIKEMIYKTLDAENKYLNVKNEKTLILNATSAVARYHAYMDILKKIDMNEFIKVGEALRDRIAELLLIEERIYK